MFLVRIIPLVKLPGHAPSVLDYFWTTSLLSGALVQAPMGRRTILALVVECLDIRAAKLSLKKADFALKKLTSVVTEMPQLSPIQIAVAHWMSSQYACSLASALATVAPSGIGAKRSLSDHSALPSPKRGTSAAGEVHITQPDTALAALRHILAQTAEQTLVLVPERILAEHLAERLPNGVACVHSGLTATQHRAIYRGVLDGTVRTVVGTRMSLFLPWRTLAHVVVEDPLNELYKSDMTPRYHAADVARKIAAFHDAQLTWLTPAISTVQHHLVGTGALRVSQQKPHWPSVTISTSQEEAQAGHRGIFARDAQLAILDAYEQRTPLLIYSARRAYATIARCRNCQSSLQCSVCEIPMRWHRTTEDMLVCYRCAAYQTVPTQCGACHAGTFKPSGTPGSQKLGEAVNVLLDRFGHAKMNIPILDSDLVRQPADIRTTLAKFDSMEHPILIATSMILSHRYVRTFHTVVVPHLDMLTMNPDYRTQDRLIVQLEKLADFMPERMLLHTHADDAFAALIPRRAWDEFFEDEVRQRKQLRWPPYARIVKLTFSHRDKVTASRAASAGADRLRRAALHLRSPGTQILGPAPALIERSAHRWTHNLIIKSTLPSARLGELLEYVPEGWSVDVDPRSIS